MPSISFAGAAGEFLSPNPKRFGFLFLKACARVCVAFVVGIPCLLHAAPMDSTRDSTHVYRMDTVTVTATPPFDWRHSIASIQTIPIPQENAIATLQSTLGEANGLYVIDYGGGAALATASTRGMYAEETTFLLDGIRINSLQNGLTDLSKIPLLGLASIQVSRGGGNVGFEESPGGTVELTTAPPPTVFTPSVTLQAGSFGEQAGAVMLPVNTGGVRTSLTAAYNTSANNYDYNFGGTTYQRTSADYTTSYFTAHSLWNPTATDAGTAHELILSYLNSNQGVSGAVTSSALPLGSRETDQNVFALLHSHWETGILPIETSIHAGYARETFLDSTLFTSGEPLLSSYINRQIDASARSSLTLGDPWVMRFGAQGLVASITSGSVYATTRTQGQAYFGADYTTSFDNSSIKQLTIRAVSRLDAYSDNTSGIHGNSVTFLTGTLGAVAALFDDRSMALRANIGTAGRMPTLNELYWIGGGNPNLQPDRSVKGELGGHYEKNILGNIAFDADGFVVSSTNLIVWEPGSGGLWTPVNIDATRSSGVEWSARWQPQEFISASFAQQFTNTIKLNASFPGDASQNKQLPYIPQETFHANVTLSLLHNTLAIKGNADYASFRYITTDNTQFIPGYTLFSASAAMHIPTGSIIISPELTCANITNESYQVFPAYPMPLRSFLFSITFSYNNENNK